MKKYLLVALCVVFAFSCGDSTTNQSRNEYLNPQFAVSFNSRDKLEWYETESDSVIGYDNDNYGVDIEVMFLDSATEDYLKEVEYDAREIAINMDFSDIEDKPECSSIKQSTCALAYNIDGVPVYVIAQYNFKTHLGYEITIYCYDNDLEEGARIAKSFQLPD